LERRWGRESTHRAAAHNSKTARARIPTLAGAAEALSCVRSGTAGEAVEGREREDGWSFFLLRRRRSMLFLRCSPCAAPSSRSAMRMNRGTIPGRLSCSHAPLCSLRCPDGCFCRVPFPLSLSLSLSLIKGARKKVRTEREKRLPPLSLLLFFRKECVFFSSSPSTHKLPPFSTLSLCIFSLSKRRSGGTSVHAQRGVRDRRAWIEKRLAPLLSFRGGSTLIENRADARAAAAAFPSCSVLSRAFPLIPSARSCSLSLLRFWFPCIPCDRAHQGTASQCGLEARASPRELERRCCFFLLFESCFPIDSSRAHALPLVRRPSTSSRPLSS